ncbi:ubiquitin carboxyl-terminal hydrolase faf-x-related [Anaeramoeba ignava]|uniref:Ubiquitin carboxyl-terminal hydrolase faf-x-related n=1 Tax=Anaeramoeba ignava TaxID=1746090 RepID=A0A9Q0L9C1_ANAIG|nr:ubiquitin carboxyl-terminal hydrolase faf-x-related [Anaeramoeba ignava]
MNYIIQYQLFLNEIKTSLNPTKVLSLLETHFPLIIQGKMDKNQEEYFLDKIFGLVVETLCQRDNYEMPFKIINLFLKSCLDLIIRKIPEENDNVLQSLQKIFSIDSSNSFYHHPSDMKIRKITPKKDHLIFWTKELSNVNESIFQDDFNFVDFSKIPAISSFLLENIEYFARNRGFEALLTQFLSKNHQISFQKSFNLLKPIGMCLEFFDSNFIPCLFPYAKKMIQKIISVKDEEYRKQQNDIDLLFSFPISILLKKSHKSALKHLQKSNLEMTIKNLKSEFLENRIIGINQLKENISRIEQNEKSKNQSDVPSWLTTENYLKSLIEYNIIDILFGHRVHTEILSRSGVVLKFLAINQKITKENIDQMWSFTQGHHQTTSEMIHKLFKNLSKFLSDEIFLYFVNEKLHKIEKFEKSSISLLGYFATISFSKFKKEKENYKFASLHKLWELTNNPLNDINERKLALNEIQKIIEENSQFDFAKNKFLNLSFESLQKKQSADFVIPILYSIFRNLPTKSNKNDNESITRTKKIQSIHKTYNILNLLIQEMAQFKTNLLNEKEKKTNEQNENSIIEENIDPNLDENMQMRFDLLSFIANSIPPNQFIKAKDANKLWDIHIKNSYNSKEQNLFFTFVNSIKVTDEIVKIFFQKSLELDAQKISILGFNFFQEYSYRINKNNKILEGNTANFQIIDPNQSKINGEEKTWEFVLKSENETVFALATKFLFNFFNLKPTIAKQHLINIRQKFIEKCISICSDNKNDLVMRKRSLNVLLEYILKVESEIIPEMLPFQRHIHTFYNEFIDLQIQIANQNKIQNTMLRIRTNNSVDFLRKKIGEIIEDKSQKFVVESHPQINESNDCKTIMDIGLFNKQTLRVLIDSDENNQISTSNFSRELELAILPEELPSFILSSHFESLYEMLENEDLEMASNAWQILMLMKTNEKILNHFSKLLVDLDINQNNKQKNIDWNQDFNSTHLLKLNYDLQIIDQVLGSFEKEQELENQENTNEKKINMNSLARSFIREKAANHLLTILFSRKEEFPKEKSNEEKRLETQNIFLLLKIISRILIEKKEGSEPSIREEFSLCGFSEQEFVMLLMDIIQKYTNIQDKMENSLDHFQILKIALQILKAGCVSDNIIWRKTLSEMEQLEQFIKSILVSSIPEIRVLISEEILEICEKSLKLEKNTIFLTKIFLSKAITILKQLERDSENVGNSTDFFDFLNKLVEQNYKLPDEQQTNLEDIAMLFTRLIKMRDSNEFSLLKNEKKEKVDTTLDGYFRILQTIISRSEKNRKFLLNEEPEFSQYLLEDCLSNFSVEENKENVIEINLPKCQTKKSQESAFSLLLNLVKNDEKKIVAIMDYIKKKLISQTNLNVEWKFNPKQKEILPTGFIGLRNLGSTCYLNSFVQQIFMVPNFVRGVFDLKFPDFSEKQAEESLLYQTQSLGAYLMASKSRFVDPRKFINTIQTWDSSKINPFVQMDVEEFMNMFFDQFAREAKSTPQKNLIQETFGAKLTHQVIIQENYKINRRVEDYYSISLDIRQKNNLLESLKEYVAPEMLSGENQYYSEELGKKVDALKRVCFETLPQNLLVHLKRFEFDFETFVRHKINDRFEFPFELDMEPYTEQAVTKNGILQENINEDEYSQEKKIESTELIENDSDNKVNHVGSTHYELTGIIAHYGSAESGHYYSFIRKRDGSSAHSATWIRFDDTYTDFYDISNIEKDCFGGLETPKKQTNQDENFNPIPPMLKPYSAYILLYTRKDVLEREALEFQNQKNSSNLFSRVELPPHLSRDIWKENISFFRQKFIFDSVFLQFLSQLFQLQNPQITDPILANNPELTKLITDIVLQVVFRSRYTSQLENWIKILQKQFSRSMELCLWFFGNYILYDSEKKKNSGDWMETNMISCRHDDIRSSSIALFQSVMQAMFEHEKEEINEAIHSLISVQRFEWDEICKTEFDIFRQWNQICESVDQAVKIYGNWPITLMLVDSIIHNSLKNSNQMFLGRRMDILMSLLNIYPPLSQYLIMTNVISKFIDLNLNYYSPLQKRDANTANLSTNSLLQLFSSQFRECPESLEIIYKLIEGVDLSLDQVQNIEKDGETNENVQNKIPLVDRVMILKTNFPELMIKNRLSPDIMGRILARICMNNSIYTQKYVSFVLLHISQAQQSQIDIEKLFTLLSCFLETKDSLFDWKVEKICEFMVNINNSEFFSSQKTVYCLSNFRLKIAKHEEVFEWMIQHQEQWVMQFLISNQNGDIRREASFLLQIVIPNQNEEISDTKASQYYEMFQYLLGLLPNLQLQVYQHIKPREFPQPDSISPFPFEFFFLTDYFNILRKSMFNEISFSSFEDNFQHFWDLFIHLDSYKLSCDFNKLELLRIFDKCISQNQENVDYLIQDSRFPRFVGSFIDIQDNPSYSQYASAYLPLFLNLVFLCIERDPTVIDSIYSSPIANDVLDKTIFDPFYDSFSEKYFSIISKISSKINFRIQKIKAILTGERVKKHPKNALKFLDLLLGSDTLLLFTFTETQNGHNTLSDLLIERISLLEKDLEISKEKEKESKKESKSKSKSKPIIQDDLQIISSALDILINSSSWLCPTCNIKGFEPKNSSPDKINNVSRLWSKKIKLFNSLIRFLEFMDFKCKDVSVSTKCLQLIQLIIGITTNGGKSNAIEQIKNLHAVLHSKVEFAYSYDSIKSSQNTKVHYHSYLASNDFQITFSTVSQMVFDLLIKQYQSHPKKGKKRQEKKQAQQSFHLLTKSLFFNLVWILHQKDANFDLILSCASLLNQVLSKMIEINENLNKSNQNVPTFKKDNFIQEFGKQLSSLIPQYLDLILLQKDKFFQQEQFLSQIPFVFALFPKSQFDQEMIKFIDEFFLFNLNHLKSSIDSFKSSNQINFVKIHADSLKFLLENGFKTFSQKESRFAQNKIQEIIKQAKKQKYKGYEDILAISTQILQFFTKKR